MERDYKKWLLREEAIKKKKAEEKNTKQQYLNEEAQKVQDSVSMAQIQSLANSPDSEEQQEKGKGNLYRRQKITRLKKSVSNTLEQQPQIAKAGKFMKQKAENAINKNPRLAQSYSNIKAFKDRRSQEIENIRKAKEEAKTKLKQKSAQLAKKAGQATARIASPVSKIFSQALKQAAGRLLAATGASVIVANSFVILIIILIIVVIVVMHEQICNSAVSGAVSAGLPLYGIAKWWVCN